jgi:hypothetical protein
MGREFTRYRASNGEEYQVDLTQTSLYNGRGELIGRIVHFGTDREGQVPFHIKFSRRDGGPVSNTGPLERMDEEVPSKSGAKKAS